MSPDYPPTLPPSVWGSHGATHLADLVQRLGQELLVDAAEVGNLLLALMVHVHATVWDEGEARPSEALPKQGSPQATGERSPLPEAQLRSGRGRRESRRKEGFGGSLLDFLSLEKNVSEAIMSTSNLTLFKEGKEKAKDMGPNSEPFRECMKQRRQIPFPLGVSRFSSISDAGAGEGVYEVCLESPC